MRIEFFEIPSRPAARDPENNARLAICHEIRRIVFVDEQGVSSDLEWDELDSPAIHFLGVDAEAVPEPKPLGTARLRLLKGYAKAERVAVLKEARGTGLGRAIMLALEEVARSRGAERIRLSAQVSVLGFYEQLGYLGYGEPFVEAGINHLAMSKLLADAN
jgi:predicted GNAT family N-acyltransferase